MSRECSEPMFTELMFVAAMFVSQDAVARADQPASAYWEGEEGWRVFAYPDEQMCDIGFPTQSGEYVTIGYRPRERAINLAVTNKHANSVRQGERKELVIAFSASENQAFSKAQKQTFEVLKVDGSTVLSAGKVYRGFLDDFTKSGVMAVLTNSGSVVAGIRLTGSSKAAGALRRCALEAAELDAKDPFIDKL